MSRTVPTALAIGVGAITLLALFFEVPALVGFRFAFVDWAAVLAVFALILGVLNLLSVHLSRAVSTGGRSGLYSTVLALSFLVVVAVALFERSGPGGPLMTAIFQYVQLPLESALAGTLAIFLVLAGYRALRQQRSAGMVALIIAALVTLAATVPLPGAAAGALATLKDAVITGPAVGGARGLILGVALGVVATGLRLLSGLDRPQSD